MYIKTELRSYSIHLKEGQMIQRNRQDLRHATTTISADAEEDAIGEEVSDCEGPREEKGTQNDLSPTQPQLQHTIIPSG